MKKSTGIYFIVFIALMMIMTACGEKSKESVVDKLDKQVDSMNGYKADAVMKMSTGQEEQEYDINIWFKKDNYYRVTLSNDNDEKGSQVILKNDDGVFVLTPELNKSFKFQTEWPENSSQPYLYQSLVNDVTEDKEAEFTTTDSDYVFLTKTNYQSNNNLPYQEIHFDKKTFTPTLVKVLDKDKKPLVEVTFTEFSMNASFKEDDFKIDEESNEEAEATSSEGDKVSDEVKTDPLSILFPLYTAGSELIEKKEVSFDDGERVIMEFDGENKFTLVQEKLDVIPTISLPKEVEGDIINLGFSIGALTENTLEWNYGGIDFHLASEELTKEELIEVAQSVTGQEVK